MCKIQLFYSKTKRLTHEQIPHCGSPISVRSFWVRRVKQMAQTMPRPSVLLVVDSFSQQLRFPVLGDEKQCVALRRNSQTMQLSSFSGFGVEVILFSL